MRSRTLRTTTGSLCAIAATCVAAACMLVLSPVVNAVTPVDVIGNLNVTDYNNNIKNQSYKDWGNEPFIAVNPTNTNEMVISSFAFGFGDSSGTASLWYSNNGGGSWNLRVPISGAPALASPPANSSGPQGPNDQTFVFDPTGTLHGLMLTSYASNINGAETSLNIYHGRTSTPGGSSANWVWTNSSNPVSATKANATAADQPWLAIGGGKVFAAYDNFGTGGEERVNRSSDNGENFTLDLPVSSGGSGFTQFVNPGTRIAADSNGNAYTIFGQSSSAGTAGVHTVNYRLNRLRANQSTWDYTTANANPGGLIIDSGSSLQLEDTQANYFGTKNQLRGNITAIATDSAGSHVYAAYGKRDGSNVDRIWLAEFHDNGSGDLVERASPVSLSITGQRAALPSVAVAANGVIGVMYDTSPSADNFQVHLATSTDFGLTFSDQLIYTFNTSAFTLGSAAIPSGNRILGDYQFLEAVGNTFFGTFVGTGNVNNVGTGVNTTDKIDPFFFSAPATVPEPAALGLLSVGGLALLARRRR